jgi:hypothetical protein
MTMHQSAGKECAVEFFIFVRRLLVVMLTVSLLWPLNVPLAALAYKIRNGPGPIPLEPADFWIRSTFASLGLAVLALVTTALDYVLAERAEIPPGIVHLVMMMLFVPAAVWYVFWMFALDELLEGVSLLVIYLFLPGFVLVVLFALFDFRFLTEPVSDWISSKIT